MKKKARKYSKFTLKPNDEQESALFWEFRCEDIAEVMVYFVVFNTCFWIVNVLAFISDPSGVSLTKALLYSLYLALYIVIWLARKRFKKWIVYMLVFLYIYMQTMNCLTSSSQIAITAPEDELQRNMALRGGYEY